MMANKMPAITIEGDAALKALIRSLPNRAITECAKAMRAVAKPIISAARAGLRKNRGVDTGLLKKSIGVRALKVDRKFNRIYMYIGPRGPGKQGFVGFKRDGKTKHVPLYIAHLIEFGHKIALGGKLTRRARSGRVTPGSGTHSGTVQGIPFLRPAVDANRSNFLEAMKAALRKAVERRIAKGEVMLNIPAWQGEGKGGDL